MVDEGLCVSGLARVATALRLTYAGGGLPLIAVGQVRCALAAFRVHAGDDDARANNGAQLVDGENVMRKFAIILSIIIAVFLASVYRV